MFRSQEHGPLCRTSHPTGLPVSYDFYFYVPVREQCEEFRLHWSQRHQKEVCADRLAQLALKEELKNQEKKEEQMFADLWEEDRLAKEKREAVDIQKQAEQNQERLNVLNAQVSVLNAQKEEAKRLKEEEARLLVTVFIVNAGLLERFSQLNIHLPQILYFLSYNKSWNIIQYTS